MTPIATPPGPAGDAPFKGEQTTSLSASSSRDGSRLVGRSRTFGEPRARGGTRVAVPALFGMVGIMIGAVALGPAHRIPGGLLSEPGTELRAWSSVGGDSDGDGVCDLQESVLGTRIDLMDTDGDGFSDLMEIARQTSALEATSVPNATSPRIGMAGFVAQRQLTMMTAFYIPDGDLSSTAMDFGISINGLTVPLSDTVLLSASTVRLQPTGSGNDLILVLETSLPEDWVHTFGTASFYVVGEQAGLPDTADVLQMFSFPGTGSMGEPMPVLVRPEPAPPGVGPTSGFGSFTSNAGGQGGNGGTIYRPLVADERVPSDWTLGQVCYQDFEVVGANGVNVVMQVQNASCEPLDTYCSPSNCLATLGELIEFVDPGAIIGG